MVKLNVVVLAAVVAAMSAQPASAHGSYYPHVPGKPAGMADGVLVNFGVGQSSGDVTIRQSNNKERSFYLAAHPFVIDGKAVECVSPPRPGSRRRRICAGCGPRTSRSGALACASFIGATHASGIRHS